MCSVATFPPPQSEEGSPEQSRLSLWGELRAGQSLLFFKAKSWIKSDDSFKKGKAKQMGLLRKNCWSAKGVFKNTWSFCLLCSMQTKYSICRRHAVTLEQQFPKIWPGPKSAQSHPHFVRESSSQPVFRESVKIPPFVPRSSYWRFWFYFALCFYIFEFY